MKGKVLGRKQLQLIGTLFTPDTILLWHRQLVANKWDDSDRKRSKPGRPRVRQEIVDLTLEFARGTQPGATTEFKESSPRSALRSPTQR